MTRSKKLSIRTVKIIENHGSIFLKKKKSKHDAPSSKDWYLGQWTNIAAGPDGAHFSFRKKALEIFNLEWAFGLAKLYNCKVVVRYPKRCI